MQMIADYMNQAGPIITALCGICSSATVLTAITPSKADDAFLNAILRVLNFLAGNVWKNKNADDK